jgi:hypothetical protein
MGASANTAERVRSIFSLSAVVRRRRKHFPSGLETLGIRVRVRVRYALFFIFPHSHSFTPLTNTRFCSSSLKTATIHFYQGLVSIWFMGVHSFELCNARGSWIFSKLCRNGKDYVITIVLLSLVVGILNMLMAR